VNPKIESILKGIEEVSDSPEGYALDLRMILADLIMAKLDERGMTQSQLAQLTGWKDSFVSRLIHADANCSTETAGRALHALGLNPASIRKIFLENNTEIPVMFHNVLVYKATTMPSKQTGTIDDQEKIPYTKEEVHTKTQSEKTATAEKSWGQASRSTKRVIPVATASF